MDTNYKYKCREVDCLPIYVSNRKYKNKKWKQAKNWETQYKNIWNGRKR